MDFVGNIDDLVDELSSDDGEVVSGAEQVSPGTYNVRDLPIGFAGMTPTTVAATQSDTLDVPIKTAFRPDRLVIEATDAGAEALLSARVADIVIGTIRLNVGSQPVPARAFRYDAVGTRLKCAVVATPSVFPQVVVTNIHATNALVFSGGFFGPMKRV